MIRNNLEQYDTMAEHWWKDKGPFAPLFHLNPYRFSYFDTFVPQWKGLRVLDVGCGGGFTTEFLAKRGARVAGVDRAVRIVEVAREHAREQGLTIDYRQGVAESLPFTNETFDVVTCVDVLEHVADLKRTIDEISRVLKPDGLFLFDTINRTLRSKFIIVWLLENILSRVPKGTHDWNMFIKPEELQEVLLQRGFDDLEFTGLSPRGENLRTKVPYFKMGSDMSTLYLGKARRKTS